MDIDLEHKIYYVNLVEKTYVYFHISNAITLEIRVWSNWDIYLNTPSRFSANNFKSIKRRLRCANVFDWFFLHYFKYKQFCKRKQKHSFICSCAVTCYMNLLATSLFCTLKMNGGKGKISLWWESSGWGLHCYRFWFNFPHCVLYFFRFPV